MHWDAKKRRYVDSRGRVISVRQVRKEVEDYVASEEKKVDAEARKLQIGLISATAFFLFMQNRIETWHKITGAIAYGGQAQMGPEQWDRIQKIIAREQSYLDGFKSEVATATEITEQVANRAGMYANAAYSTYENQTKERESDAGVILGRRVSEEDERSCDACIEAATTEYMPLAELPDIGSLTCLNNCRCTIEFNYEGVEPISIDRAVYAQYPITVQ